MKVSIDAPLSVEIALSLFFLHFHDVSVADVATSFKKSVVKPNTLPAVLKKITH
jgi:hypothetical protein